VRSARRRAIRFREGHPTVRGPTGSGDGWRLFIVGGHRRHHPNAADFPEVSEVPGWKDFALPEIEKFSA
jgi:hypothetical protein